ncbi:MAG: integral rane sensor signal transduction histidine kinase [Bacteroidetes bacterium]|nr:integral rane sensor signal transduction histidine kinase [Bacteroidota bacterium]
MIRLKDIKSGITLNKIYELSRHFKLVFILVGAAIILVSTMFTNRLARELAREEQKKIEIWAEATRQLITADNNSDIDFISKIIEENTTIPVIIIDDNDEMILARNFAEPKKNIDQFYTKEIKRLKPKHTPIGINLNNNYQYIIYDDSVLLKQLYIFPYVQLGVIVVFLLIAFFAFSSTKKEEQNRVWVGLSKETAHQLGTPISSLLAWVDLLKTKYQDEKLLPEMAKDVNRLRIIAERFSKIGSAPDLQIVSLNETIQNAVQYMSNRSSQKVSFSYTFQNGSQIFTHLNVPLFEWVIENLCKNAIDAMDGIGSIDITINEREGAIIIDVKDTGKGIERNKFKTIFNPGFTTKKRGWGLGLSLAKRIIEEYHNGKIFVKTSEINAGTTFRIILKA